MHSQIQLKKTLEFEQSEGAELACHLTARCMYVTVNVDLADREMLHAFEFRKVNLPCTAVSPVLHMARQIKIRVGS